MPQSELHALQQEWHVLQKQFFQFELTATLLKLLSVISVLMLLFHSRLDVIVPIVCLLLWIQEAMLKAYQQRTGARILVVEKAIAEQQNYKAMQFHTTWLDGRPSSAGLLLQYFGNMWKPTVLFPHMLLLILSAYIALV